MLGQNRAKGVIPLTEYMTEQEQIQQIKNWLKQYGVTILIGIAVALLLTSGWRHWQSYRDRILLHASAVYDEMLTLRAQNNKDAAVVQAHKIITHYKNTPYAALAAFMLARDAVTTQHYAEAVTQLNWAIDNTHDRSVREIARIRLARVLIADKKPDAALKLLNNISDKSFMGLIDEVRGDAYLSQNNTTLARQAYQLALSEIPDAEAARPILQMKLGNLAVADNTK